MNKSKFLKLINHLTFNNSCFYDSNIIKISNYENKEDIFEQIYKYQELINYISPNNAMEFIYFNMKSIHKIIYEKEEFIVLINGGGEKKKLPHFFYLDLLIKDNPNIVNYKYSFNYIKTLNDKTNNNKNIYNTIFISKIILDLIQNYEKFENIEEILKTMRDNNDKIINDLITKILNNDLDTKFKIGKKDKIDKIYIDIILALIKNEKLKDDKFASNILDQLEIESINITKEMFEEINNSLNIENINEKYLISTNKDLLDFEKINFYYLLFKYILKNPLFIYQNKFLSKTRKKILEIVKNIINFNNINDKEKERLDFVLKYFLDSYYYEQKYFSKNNSEKETKKDSKENQNDSKDENQINSNNSIIPKNSKEDIDSDILFISDNNSNSVNSPYDNKNNISNNKLPSSNSDSFSVNKSITHKNDIISFFDKVNCINMNTGPEPPNKENKLVKEIKNLYNTKFTKEKNISIDDILKVNNNFFCYGKNSNIIIYNTKYEKKNENIENIKDINNISEGEQINDNREIIICRRKEIIKYYLNKEGILKGKNKYNVTIKNETEKLDVLFAMKFSGKYFFCDEKEISYSDDIFSNKKNIENILIKCIIKINEKLIAFKSNRVASKGKDKLIFYNSTETKILDQIDIRNSFIYSEQGLKIFSQSNTESKSRVLLCACKKYIRNQKNGILVVTIDENENYKIDDYFYNTGNFEVYCFCQILLKKEIQKKLLKQESNFTETNYFLVGGFNINKCKGIIKLFKINYGNNYNEIKIEYIDDITFPDKNIGKFSGPISCITQSNNNDFLISFWNGEIYLLKELNISKYLSYSG